jgi:hypothetical protein
MGILSMVHTLQVKQINIPHTRELPLTPFNNDEFRDKKINYRSRREKNYDDSDENGD